MSMILSLFVNFNAICIHYYIKLNYTVKLLYTNKIIIMLHYITFNIILYKYN